MRIRPSIIIGIVLLTVWGVFLTVGVMVYVRYGTAQLSAVIAGEVTGQTGLPCRIGGASPKLLPSPHIVFREVSLTLPVGQVDAPEISAFVSWRSLFRGRFIPGRVVLEKPLVDLDFTAVSGPDGADADEDAGAFGASALPEDLRNMRVIIHEGQIRIRDSRGQIRAEDCIAVLRLPGRRAPYAEVSAGLAEVIVSENAPVRLERLRLNVRGEESRKSAFERADASARVIMEGLTPSLDVSAMLGPGADGAVYDGAVRLEGHLASTPPIPLTLHTDFSAHNTHDIRLKKLDLQLDKDNGSLSGTLSLGDWGAALAEVLPHPAGSGKKPVQPGLSGKAVVGHLSLPRWFNFARSLPSGLEHALDNLSGELDFTLTPQTLTVPKVKALLCGASFSGSGGVPDFSKPEIRLKARAASADINKVFPELLQAAPTPLRWDGPPPVGGGEDDDTEGPDYDIQLSAGKVRAWKLDAGDFSLGIAPRPRGCRLTINAGKFYDGTLESVTDIADAVTIKATLKNVQAEAPFASLSGAKVVRGSLDGFASLTAAVESFDHFVASLGGTLEGTIRGGSLGTHDSALAFDNLHFAFAPKGSGLGKGSLPGELPFAGKWTLGLKTPDWTATAGLNGTLVLDSATLAPKRFADLPGQVEWTCGNVQSRLNARFAFDAKAQRFDVSGVSGSINGGKLSGSLAGRQIFDAPSWSGRFSLNSTALGQVLAGRDLLPAGMPKGTFQHLEAGGAFAFVQDGFSLTDLKGRLDDTLFSGSARRVEAAGKPGWHVSLALGTVNLSRYLPQSQPGQKQSDWPLDSLHDLAVSGTISLDALRISKMVHGTLKIPFFINDNILRCAPMSFSLYGGQGEAELQMQGTAQGYRGSLRYTARNVDSAAFCREAGLDTILGGTLSLKAELGGLLRRGADIPAALDGTWSFSNVNGYMSERRKDGAFSPPTAFRSLGATGVMQKGVLKTEDFELRSDNLAAKGRALINLVNWTLDCRLNVSTRTFNNVPVVYKGSLDAPERSVNALNAVTGTLNKIGSGVFGLMEDMLTTPFRLFQR